MKKRIGSLVIMMFLLVSFNVCMVKASSAVKMNVFLGNNEIISKNLIPGSTATVGINTANYIITDNAGLNIKPFGRFVTPNHDFTIRLMPGTVAGLEYARSLPGNENLIMEPILERGMVAKNHSIQLNTTRDTSRDGYWIYVYDTEISTGDFMDMRWAHAEINNRTLIWVPRFTYLNKYDGTTTVKMSYGFLDLGLNDGYRVHPMFDGNKMGVWMDKTEATQFLFYDVLRNKKVPVTGDATMQRIINQVNISAAEYGLDPVLIMAQIWNESKFEPNALGEDNDKGLMQIRPGAASDFRIDHSALFNIEYNIQSGTRILRFKMFDMNNSIKDALRAYNAGTTGATSDCEAGLDYAKNILEKYDEYKMNGIRF